MSLKDDLKNNKYKRFCYLKNSGIIFNTFSENDIEPRVIAKCLNVETSCKQLKCIYAGGECDPFIDVHRHIHSDFLIHWTGRDIDDKYEPNWEKKNDTILNKEIVGPYIERLKNILEHGLWMTSSESDSPLICKGREFGRLPFARTCFSELKLSESHIHAKRFGRLGIGVKRFFVSNKRGAPMIYFRPECDNYFFTNRNKITQNECQFQENEFWSYYLKSMDEGRRGEGFVQYKNFDESEWRIIYSSTIEKELGKIRGIENLSDNKFAQLQSYLIKNKVPETKWPQYLLKLDSWFAIIIYPSLAVKVYAEADESLRKLINSLKPNLPENTNPEASAGFEKYSKPFEIDLNSCINF